MPGVTLQQAGSTSWKKGKLFWGSTHFGFTLCWVLPLCCSIIATERSFSLPAACCDPSVLPASRELVLKPSCACAPLSLIPTLHPSPDRLSTPTLVSPLYENTSPVLLFCSREPHTESHRHMCWLAPLHQVLGQEGGQGTHTHTEMSPCLHPHCHGARQCKMILMLFPWQGLHLHLSWYK